MSMPRFVIVACLGCVPLLLTGALRPQDIPGLSRSASGPLNLFRPGVIQLPHGWGDQPALAYLDSVVQNLRPTKITSLDMDLWQRFDDDDTTFTAVGRLAWSAQQKARLEWKVLGRQTSNLLVVSDGTRLLRRTQLGENKAEAEHYRLPAGQDRPEGVERCWRVLSYHGCTGFLPLLTELRVKGTNWTRDLGHWRNRPVVRLTASLTPGIDNGIPRQSADRCRLFLDGASLWPVRLEWSKSERVFLEMEFRPRAAPANTEELAQLFDTN